MGRIESSNHRNIESLETQEMTGIPHDRLFLAQCFSMMQ